MRNKILTVDDSKTVRIIVRKAFKSYDCEILEASNGVEGLAVAGKEMPDLILLDITMPVMDGVEMLTRLKSDPQLKGIPVMMLTAEGGKDNVLRIAKIGIRDYIVKPFKEELLIEKAGRIIELKPLTDAPSKVRSIFDAATILVVEDKPAIIQQIQAGLKHTPWKVHGVSTQGEAMDFWTRTPPDLIMISLTLPEDAAFTLFRLIRSNVKTKYTPVFGLVVKTEVAPQQQAQTVGFTTVITKPIDVGELETKIAKAMNLDTSQRYFKTESDMLVMRLPENCGPAVLAEISMYLKPKLSEAVDAGNNKAVIDVHPLKTVHMGVIKLLLTTMQTCRDLGVQFALVGNVHLIAECKGFEDTRNWVFHDTLENAKASFGSASAPAPAPAPAAAEAAPAAPAASSPALASA
jgi:two-component system cell cycle response regulator